MLSAQCTQAPQMRQEGDQVCWSKAGETLWQAAGDAGFDGVGLLWCVLLSRGALKNGSRVS